MVQYPDLSRLLLTMIPEPAPSAYDEEVIPLLVRQWLEYYDRTAADSEVRFVTLDRYTYLFDVTLGRLISAWGVSAGRNSSPRPNSRMSGHPGAGRLYHRGHAIAHSMGGGTDINLVAQLGAVNIGPFRVLENAAIDAVGALYFSYWMYPRTDTQRPEMVQQGLLVPGHVPDIRLLRN